MKNIRDFYPKKFSFLEVKFSIYLNRHVFVMINGNFYEIILIFIENICVLLNDLIS